MGDVEQADWPKAVEEAVDRLLADMKDEDDATLRAMPEAISSACISASACLSGD